MDVTRKPLPEQHYIYVDRECPYGPEIADAMGSAFGEVFGFVSEAAITPLSMPMTVYMGMDPKILRFRGGVMVSAEDAAKASGGPTGAISSASIPAGDVMMTLHTGPYDNMNQTHQALWSYMEDNSIAGTFPIWEVYIDDPGNTAPDALRTEIYRKIG